jgi:hypothetical protein
MRRAFVAIFGAAGTAACSAEDAVDGDDVDAPSSQAVDPSIIPGEGAVVIATTCATNCSSACPHTSFRRPCPNMRHPGRMCNEEVVEPLCKARCEAERALDCNLGVNGCDLWRTNNIWREGRDQLALMAPEGSTAEQCVALVTGGASAASAYGATEKFIEGGLKALYTISKASVVLMAGSEAAKHGAICACRDALP